MNNIIAIIGKSGTGKDSLAKLISERLNYNFVVLNSSRPQRAGESEGNPYFFNTKEEFEKLIENNELIEYRAYNTLVDGNKDIWYYGIHKSSIENNKSYVIVIELEGLKVLKKLYGKRVKSFFIDTNDEIREIRAKIRTGFNQIEWDRRLIDDNKVFKKASNSVNYTIYNNDDCLEFTYAKLILKLKHLINS